MVEDERYKLYQGDCLEVMDGLISLGVKFDAIIADPPYGTTACKWDSIIPLDEMWKRLNKLIKIGGAIVLFGSEPFSSKLRLSNLENYKYDWIWNKNKSSSALNCNYQPLKIHEIITVFSDKASTYSKNGNMCYFPQGLMPCNKIQNRHSNRDEIYHKSPNIYTVQKYTNYPTSILEYSHDKEKYHPTQKPVPLLEYLIKTYTNKGDLVLDFTMGSGSTGVAALNTNRRFVGIELDENYFNTAVERLKDI